MLAERLRRALIECTSAIHGAIALPFDKGYRLYSQTLGYINASLIDALSQTRYDYLIPTLLLTQMLPREPSPLLPIRSRHIAW